MIEQYYNVIEVSNIFDVNPETVRRWIRHGDLSSVKRSNRAGNKIPESALNDFVRLHPEYYFQYVTNHHKTENTETDMNDSSYEELIRKIVREELDRFSKSHVIYYDATRKS